MSLLSVLIDEDVSTGGGFQKNVDNKLHICPEQTLGILLRSTYVSATRVECTD